MPSFARANPILPSGPPGLVSLRDFGARSPAERPDEQCERQKLQVLVPLSGSFLYREEGRFFFGDVNHQLVVPSSRQYKILHSEGSLSLCLSPKPPIAEEFFGFKGDGCDETQIRVARPATRLAIFSLIRAAYRGPEALTIDELTAELCERIAESEQIDGFRDSSKNTTTLLKAKEFIHDRFRDPITLADVALAAGVSPAYLTQLFKGSLGMPLHQYIMSLRLGEAMYRIARTADITTLAFELGFSSHSHFTAAFRSHFGIAPSNLRCPRLRASPQCSSTPSTFDLYGVSGARTGESREANAGCDAPLE